MKETPVDHPPTLNSLPNIKTSRLDLRRFQSTDLDELALVFSNREVWQYPFGKAFTRKETEAFLKTQMQEWQRCGFGCWIAREIKSNRVIGYVGISVPHFLPEILPAVEIGWRFDPTVWGKGYASEGANAALEEAFSTLGLDEIYSVPQADNPASGAVCERIGMQLEKQVSIPSSAKRGELAGLLYKITAKQWSALHG